MKEVNNYTIRQISFEDYAQEIIDLRDLSWSENPTKKPIKYSVAADRILDVKCIHMVIEKDQKIYAAGRMIITDKIEEIPHNQFFGADSKEQLKGKMGSITRVVVHPDHRMNGLAVKIMMAIEEEAKNRGVNTLIGYPADWSMKLMNNCNYRLIENLGDIIKELPGFDHYLMIKELN